MSSHPHSQGNKPGSYPDQVERPDVQFGGIGRPFASMTSTAPVTHMTTPHFVTSCPSCAASILWAHHGGDGVCGGCGAGLTTDASGLPAVM